MHIGGFQKQSLVDFPARISAVVFTQGCNFRCPFCHNPALLSDEASDGERFPVQMAMEYITESVTWLDAVCITGGEPTLQKGLKRFCAAVKELGLEVKLDTNGSRPDVLKALLADDLLDAVAMDVKTRPQLAAYSHMVGRPLSETCLQAVCESMKLLEQSGLPIDYRTTILPGLHQFEDLQAIFDWLPASAQWSWQAFCPGYCLDPAFNQYPAADLTLLEAWKRNLSGPGPDVQIR